MFNVRVKYTKKITIGNQNMVWRRPILFLPSCKDFYMYYNQRAWMTPPYNKQLIEGHTSWGLWTYLNSSCCNTLSISYSANNVLRGGDGERAQTFIVLVSLEKQYRSTSHLKERKKNLKYCRGIRCSAGLLNLQSLKNLMTVVSLASFVD